MLFFLKLPVSLSCKIALSLSAIFFVIIYPLLNIFAWNHLPNAARSVDGDFPQYYSAALAVKMGMSEHLYAVPNAELYSRPPDFRPLISTPLFDPLADDARNGNWAYYPQVSTPLGSKLSDELTSKVPELENNSHFVSPPPLALLLTPLALFDYHTASRFIWFPLMYASMFGISFFSAKLCRYVYNRETYVEAVAAALPLIPALLGSNLSTSLSIGNASPLLGFLIALATYSFVTNRQILLGFCIIPLILFKGIGLTWCPLLILGGMKWRAIAVMAALTVILNAMTFYLGGTGVYQQFFNDILPKANIPLGISLEGTLMIFLGINPKLIITSAYIFLLILAYSFYFLSIRKKSSAKNPIIEILIATVSLFILFNKIVWPHYFTLYLFLPFFPWIYHEICLRYGIKKYAMFFLMASIIFCWMDSIFVTRDSWIVGILKYHDIYFPPMELLRSTISRISFYVIPNAASALFAYLSLKRIYLIRQKVRLSAVASEPTPQGS